MEERFSVQIKNLDNGFKTLFGFEMVKGEPKLISLTQEDFHINYIIDTENDIHKCIVPVLKRIKNGKD